MEIQVLHRQGKGIRRSRERRASLVTRFDPCCGARATASYGPRDAATDEARPAQRLSSRAARAAGKVRLPATVLMREIRAQGYEGGITQLKEYLREIRPAAPHEPIVRFETEPGRSCRSTSSCSGAGDRRCERSPRSWATRDTRTSSSPTTSVARRWSRVWNALALLWRRSQHILCDNPKTIVIERNAYGEGLHRFNSVCSISSSTTA